jgi:uncharacterized PurR-regulated membrane protein YhhQ (DUF165 family)
VHTTANRAITITTVGSFLAAIVAANWMTTRWGFVSLGFGVTSTAGVYAAGLTFGLRDACHELGGRLLATQAIVAGAALSYFIAPSLAFASAAAFLISEFADLSVYTPLRKRNWVTAVVASNFVGAIVDTVVFLQIAGFPIRSALKGQMIGNMIMILPGLAVVRIIRGRR